MPYNPDESSQRILERALFWVQSVPYTVTARWVFYRLLQEGIYDDKTGYKHLLRLLSKARKEFYGEWRPWTLADDSRAALVRGTGFRDFKEWVTALTEQLEYPPDAWDSQPHYVEVWFEAAAMESQFRQYTPRFVPLLAFHGDVSIPEKWKAAKRLLDRRVELQKPVVVLYYGDLDRKGLEIPESAWNDIYQIFMPVAYFTHLRDLGVHRTLWPERWKQDVGSFVQFVRVGLTEEQVRRFRLPENPERPNTWQWEALDDDQAQELIGAVEEQVDLAAYQTDLDEAKPHTEQLRKHLRWLL